MLYRWTGLLNKEHETKETGLKVGCFAGFCHHCLAITSAHMYAYHYSLFESDMKTGLWTIALCRKDIKLAISVNTKTNSKADYSYNGIWCATGYGSLMNGIL